MFEELQIHVQSSMLFTWLLTKAFLLVYLIKGWLKNSLIIHEEKRKEITTLSVVSYVIKNHICINFNFEFLDYVDF